MNAVIPTIRTTARGGFAKLTGSSCVADAMLANPKVQPGSASVGEIRGLFRDDHVQIALLVDERRLIATIERRGPLAATGDETPALSVGQTSGGWSRLTYRSARC